MFLEHKYYQHNFLDFGYTFYLYKLKQQNKVNNNLVN